jgi:hypothetical protein
LKYRGRDVVIGAVQIGRRETRHYVEAEVDGRRVWFDSADEPLDASAEAFASAMWLPAARVARRLRVESPVSAHWQANVTEVAALLHEWWGYPALVPATRLVSARRPPQGGVLQCFTGGVDSFHTLIHGTAKPDALVFVQGYDIRLDDPERMRAWETTFREVAVAVGVRAVTLRSNLRAHPLVARSQWDRAHGGALAALGHLLAPIAGTLVLASSFPVRYGYRWGSHPRLDPLWSSDRVEVVHEGADQSRIDKVAAIAGHDLPRRYLRVCWENRAPTGNCSRCDKCVNTMAIIASVGDPAGFRTFDWSVRPHELIRRQWGTRFVRTYGELLNCNPPPALAGAIRGLLKRNAVPARLRAVWDRWRG